MEGTKGKRGFQPQPEKLKDKGGSPVQLCIRLPASLKLQLINLARDRNMTLSCFVEQCIRDAVDHDES